MIDSGVSADGFAKAERFGQWFSIRCGRYQAGSTVVICILVIHRDLQKSRWSSVAAP
jgi:hypothetical protein